ncbi:MAG: hypothetical protein AAGG57_06435 [Pseudomonadota bacterium]
MTEFLTLLALYYGCDATATERYMSQREVVQCVSYYHGVKAHFVEDETGLDRAERNLEGFLRFKSWEDENEEIVAQLKAQLS